jgi:hypothetical protein
MARYLVAAPDGISVTISSGYGTITLNHRQEVSNSKLAAMFPRLFVQIQGDEPEPPVQNKVAEKAKAHSGYSGYSGSPETEEAKAHSGYSGYSGSVEPAPVERKESPERAAFPDVSKITDADTPEITSSVGEKLVTSESLPAGVPVEKGGRKRGK